MRRKTRAHRTYRAWTEGEREHMTLHWGVVNLWRLCRALDRTPASVLTMAKRLGLRAAQARQGTETITALAKRLGYAVITIQRAAVNLKFFLTKAPRASIGGGVRRPLRPQRVYAIDAEMADKIAAYLLSLDRRQPSPGTTPKGAWGGRHLRGGQKPDACLSCGQTGRPHHGRGLCTLCFNRARLARLAEAACAPSAAATLAA